LFSFAQKDDLNLPNQDLPRINDLAAKIKTDKNSLIFLSVFPIQYLALIAANPWEIDDRIVQIPQISPTSVRCISQLLSAVMIEDQCL